MNIKIDYKDLGDYAEVTYPEDISKMRKFLKKLIQKEEKSVVFRI